MDYATRLIRINKSPVATGFHNRKTCPICSGSNTENLCELAFTDDRLQAYVDRFYHRRVDYTLLKTITYRVVRCRQCDFIYQQEVLDDMGMVALYGDWVDHEQSLGKKRNAKTALFRQYSGQIQTLQRLFPGPPEKTRILEYGMGWGYWCRMAQAHGFEVSGYEISARRCEHAKSMGLDVIDELPPLRQNFDFIFSNQVFEHLPDPLATLVSLSQRLATGGVIYIRVPDGRGVVRSLRQRGWSPDLDAIHPLEHINCFTRSTLIRLAAAAGLKPFNPPPRLDWSSLRGAVKREIADRFFTTHVYFKRSD